MTGAWSGATPITLDATTHINGIEIGIGSGWGATFDGAVDNVHFAFGSQSVTTDFGAPVTPVDTINNFVSGQDTIDLSRLLTGVGANANVNDYVKAVLDSSGNTHLSVDANGTVGGASYVEFAVVTHATVDLQHDIILI